MRKTSIDNTVQYYMKTADFVILTTPAPGQLSQTGAGDY
jgi:hypothetical protein